MSIPHVKSTVIIVIPTPLIVDLIPDPHAEVSGDFCADSDHCIGNLGMRMWFEWTPSPDPTLRERKGSVGLGEILRDNVTHANQIQNPDSDG